MFTTHTPEEAGNPRTDSRLLDRMGFFDYLPLEEVRRITGINDDLFNWALGALRLAGRANAVSKRHRQVCEQLWQGYTDISPLMSITNAQNKAFWGNTLMDMAVASNEDATLLVSKKNHKDALFDEVANQTGDLYINNVFTIVWARRFAEAR